MGPDSGEILDNRALGGMGCAAIAPGIEDEHLFVGNFYSGEVIKYRLADSEVSGRNNISEKFSLSGVA